MTVNKPVKNGIDLVDGIIAACENIITDEVPTEHTVSSETIQKHLKELSFHPSPYPDERPHTMAIYIDGYLDQYVSLTDDAIDAIIEKREAMRAFISSQREE